MPPSVKCAYSVKKILFEKLPSTVCCTSIHSTYLNFVNGQLALVVTLAGHYVDEGVVIPENNKELTHSSLFVLQFSGPYF